MKNNIDRHIKLGSCENPSPLIPSPASNPPDQSHMQMWGEVSREYYTKRVHTTALYRRLIVPGRAGDISAAESATRSSPFAHILYSLLILRAVQYATFPGVHVPLCRTAPINYRVLQSRLIVRRGRGERMQIEAAEVQGRAAFHGVGVGREQGK